MNGQQATGQAGRWLMVAAIVAVVATVVAALFVMETPTHERAERLDAIRVQQLQLLSQRLDVHFEMEDELPDSIVEVVVGSDDTFKDPVTGEPYAYKPTGERTYRLCATFDTAQDPQATGRQDEWRHPAGQHCFERQARPVVRPGVPVPARGP